jgi:hypothetical protein
MPTGRFEPVHNTYFDAIDGAFTAMTAAEVGKTSFNVKADIKKMAICNKLGPAVNRNIKDCTFKVSTKVSGFSVSPVTLRFRYSKPDTGEMTIYFNTGRGIPSSKLVTGNIWFIYIKENDPVPRLGIMTPAEWTVASAKRRITKKVLPPKDILAEKNLDLELLDDIQNAEIPQAASFEYSGRPKEKQAPVSTGDRNRYRRDKQVSTNALIRAEHKCEIDPLHTSFIRKRNDLPYMEPHHLIPLEHQDNFDSSLDVEENVVSLCSNCHNHLHYGKNTGSLLKQLYDVRIEHLRRTDIEVSFDELLDAYR